MSDLSLLEDCYVYSAACERTGIIGGVFVFIQTIHWRSI